MSWFWGLLQMTLSIEIKRLKTHRVFNLVEYFATSWRKEARLRSGLSRIYSPLTSLYYLF
jgi:hypothetical protein